MRRRPPDLGPRSSRPSTKLKISTEKNEDHAPYTGARVGEAPHPGPYRRPKRREPGLGIGLEALRPLLLQLIREFLESLGGDHLQSLLRDAFSLKGTKAVGKPPPTPEQTRPPKRRNPKPSPPLSPRLRRSPPSRPLTTHDPTPSQSPSLGPRRSGSPLRSESLSPGASALTIGTPRHIPTTSASRPLNPPPASSEPWCSALPPSKSL